MQVGYIKLHRCILDSSWSRQPDFVAVWVHCLLRGNYEPSDVVTKGGTIVHLEPGQFIASRLQISLATGVQESKVERILKVFKIEHQIEQRNMGVFRVISILNWSKYQQNEQDDEQQLNNNRTTIEQRLNTDKKVKKDKKEKKEESAGILFSDNVLMTAEEREKLVELHGEDFTAACIDKLSNFKASTGKTYKNDYRAILTWVVDAVTKNRPALVPRVRELAI